MHVHSGSAGTISRRFIGSGAYTLPEVAFLLRIPTEKVKRWARGHAFQVRGTDHFSPPLIEPDLENVGEAIVSFQQLIEFAVIKFFRHEGVSMGVVRAAHTKACEIFNTEHPFATRLFRTDGRGIFSKLTHLDDFAPERMQLELSKSQLTHDELIEPFLRDQIGFSSEGRAERFWPMGKSRTVVIDPARSYGRPIIGSNGTPTFMIYQMYIAGENQLGIAEWYNIETREVELAIAYETELRAVA